MGRSEYEYRFDWDGVWLGWGLTELDSCYFGGFISDVHKFKLIFIFGERYIDKEKIEICDSGMGVYIATVEWCTL